MPTRNIARRKTVLGYANPAVSPIYVDSDDNRLKYTPAGEGTTEVSAVSSSDQLVTDVRAVANVDTGETDLVTYSLPAGTLANNGDALRITAQFEYAANANSKTSKLYFGSTVIGGRGAAADNGSKIVVQALIVRTGAATQIAHGTTAVSTTATQLVSFTAPSETLSGAITIKLTGQSGTASSDVTSRLLKIEYLPVGTYVSA